LAQANAQASAVATRSRDLCLTKDALFPKSTIGGEKAGERREKRKSKAKGKVQKAKGKNAESPKLDLRAGGYFCGSG
jgi:hypothetical protein